MNTGHTPGYLINKINEALCSAFPDKHKLEMMVLYELNIKLNEIASVGNLKVIVHNLIIHCQASNELEKLIDGALKKNPNNVQLKAINKEFKITTSLINILIPLESAGGGYGQGQHQRDARRPAQRSEGLSGLPTRWLRRDDGRLSNRHASWTELASEGAARVEGELPEATYDPVGRTLWVGAPEVPIVGKGTIAVVS
ncbi:MAG: hypothetical protein F6K44_13790, partial [Moorea sp. SIO3E2]|nr:hypothetical protein [Moorena sp. SIO3E2]